MTGGAALEWTFPDSQQAPRGARLFGIRVRRRIAARLQLAKARLGDRFLSDPDCSIAIPPWSAMAGIPGNARKLPWSLDPSERKLVLEAPLLSAHARRLRMFTPNPVDVTLANAARNDPIEMFARDLPVAAASSYQSIDWHRDFLSGYRWNPEEFYLDVRVAPVAGADIKVPRELSRFQHIGALAGGPLEQGGIEFLLQVLDWIDANPVRRGVNWACAMDVALRVVNWIWGLRLFEPVVAAYPEALGEISRSVYLHGRHIERNLEYYEECTGNHYLSNVAGLLYIGAAYPEFPESDRWTLFALQELVSEMGREVYVDGAAHEASTHYHRLVAELFVSCAALAERLPAARRARLMRVNRSKHPVLPRLRAPEESGLVLAAQGPVLPRAFYDRLARMAEFTAALTKPNGLVPQFGDNDSARVHKLLPSSHEDVRDHRHLVATIGELLGRDDLQGFGQPAADEAMLVAGGLRGAVAAPRPHVPPSCDTALFPVAGIAIVRRGNAYLAVTCGPNGQGGRGGHGHNDKLSFELNVEGCDIVVDGGCPVYTADAETRNRFRATAAHSTIAVTGREQDAWPPGPAGLFRLPERSRPQLAIEPDGTVSGQHTGYGAPHRRLFRLLCNRLDIEDTLDLAAERRLVFNLDPAVSCVMMAAEGDTVRCTLAHPRGLRLQLAVHGGAEPVIGDGCFSIGYGAPVPTRNLSVKMSRASAHTQMIWGV